jgi:hypothetical protein
MKRIAKATPAGRRITAMALLTFVLATGTSVFAKKHDAKTPEQSATVIAHLPLPGSPVSQTFLQQQGNKQYLYIQQTSKQDFMVVDVTQPEHPDVVKAAGSADKGSGEKLRMVGSGLALAETPDSSAAGGTRHELAPAKAAPAAGDHPAESVRVLDLSDPANPRTLQTFDGVSSILADDARNLIYITNGDGLWILRHKQPKPATPKCDSESVFSPIADCQ